MRQGKERGARDRHNTGFFGPGWTRDPRVEPRPERHTANPRPLRVERRSRPAAGGKCRLYVLLPLLLCGAPLTAQTRPAAKVVRVVFRFDDTSASSKVETEACLIEALRKHHMCCTWAIVPFPPLGEKAKMIQEAVREGVVEIALHGYDHAPNRLKEGALSEFDRLAYDGQLQRIREGKKSLETELRLASPIRVFVPPWGSYDANTIRAAEATQFTCFGAGLGGQAGSSSAMGFLPGTCALAAVREGVRAARAAPEPEPIVIITFHPYDFREHHAELGVLTFPEFNEMLQWLAQQPDVKVVPMGEVSGLSRARYLANQRLYDRRRWLPMRLRDWMPYSRVYFSPDAARIVGRREWPRLAGVYAGFYGGPTLAVAVATFLAAGLVFARWTGWAARLLWFSGPALLVCTLVWVFYSSHLGVRIRMIAALLGAVAWCAGICAAKIWRTQRGVKCAAGAGSST